MLFAGTAAVGGVALLTVFSTAPLPPPDVARALAAVGYGLVFVFGVRAAGIYMISTTTLARTVGLLPRWMAVLSYLAAAFLLVSTTFHPAILLVLPAWVLLFSVVVLVGAGRTRPSPTALPEAPAPAVADGSAAATTPRASCPEPRPPPRRTEPMSTTIALDEIPGPRGLPLVGNAFDIDGSSPIEGFLRMADEYGPDLPA